MLLIATPLLLGDFLIRLICFAVLFPYVSLQVNNIKIESMHVTVIVPTYGNRKSIFRLLDSLKLQTYKDFHVLLIYKENEGKKEILEGIKDCSGVEIEIITQRKGRFEEALNIAYSKADGELGLNTDDDAHAEKNWIEEHVRFHRKHGKAGIATGKVIEEGEDSFLSKFLNEQKWRMNKHTIIDRPINERFGDYGMYIGRSGMLVDTGRKKDGMRTFKMHGVNMSWKRDALESFKLPCYTKAGGRNEAAAALEVLKRGYEPIWFNNGIIYHPRQESDSRSTSIASIPKVLTAESVLFSYYVSRYTDYSVRIDTLKRRATIDDLMARLVTVGNNNGYSLGLGIALEAIKEGWKPERVRLKLIESLN